MSHSYIRWFALVALFVFGLVVLLPGALSLLVHNPTRMSFPAKPALAQSDGSPPTPSPAPPSCGGQIRVGNRVTDRIPWTGGSCTYYLQGGNGQVVTITMEDTDGQLDTYLELWDSAGNLITSDDDSAGNTDSLISAQRLSASGTYRVVARSYNNEGQGAFVLSVTSSESQVSPPTPVPTGTPAPPSCGGQIAIGERKTERIPWTGGSCTYYLPGRTGQVVTITMEDTDGQLDAFLELWDPAGNLITSDDDGAGNTDSRIGVLRLSADGTYRVVARSYNNEGRGTFALTVTSSDSQVAPPTPAPRGTPAPPSCGGQIAIGERRTERIPWTGGKCAYYLSAVEGSRVTIQMSAIDMNMDSYLELLDSVGNVLIADDDSAGNGNSLISNYRMPSSADYVIVARTYNDEGSGQFVLSVSSTQPAPPGASDGSDNSGDLLDQVLLSIDSSSVPTPYKTEAALFARSLVARLGDFADGGQNPSANAIQAALGKTDVGDRINGIVNQVWSDWRAYNVDYMHADPARSGQSPFRQLVIRLIQSPDNRLNSADRAAIYSLLTRSESLDTWRNNARGVIGAINREVYGQ